MKTWMLGVLLLTGWCWIDVRSARAEATPLRIAAAASLRDVVGEIVLAYERQHAVVVQPTFNASGQIVAMIRAGAPVDVFLSAGTREVDALVTDGLVDPDSRTVFAGNVLVLVVSIDAKAPPTSFDDLKKPAFGKVAMGQPKTVPAGLYAQQVLDHLKLTSALEGRVVYASHVRQVLDYVARGEVGAGLVYRTDAAALKEQVKIVATAEKTWHEPIEYTGVRLKDSKQAEEGKRFLTFLKGVQARGAFVARGFEVGE